MKIKTIAAGFAIVSVLSVGGLVISNIWSKDPVPPGLAAATTWSPPQLPLPTSIETENTAVRAITCGARNTTPVHATSGGCDGRYSLTDD